MGMKFKKILSAFVSAVMLSTVSSQIPGNIISAETDLPNTNYLYGDANLDGSITNQDALYIQDYLLGKYQVTQVQFTAMDYNQDKVVDAYDAQKIMQDALTGFSYNYFSTFYAVPDNSGRTYYKHICNTGTSSTYSSYTISAATNTIPNYLPDIDDEFITENQRAIDLPDNENTCCVELLMTDYNNNTYWGSGINMKGNVIATAAHCLYNTSLGFMKSVEVFVYNANCTSLLAYAPATSIHIPADYIVTNNDDTISYDVNYDYGLVYFNASDLVYYDDDFYIGRDRVKIGVMSDEFMYTTSSVTTSGFTSDNTHPLRRYYSTGQIQNMDNLPSEKPYRFHSLGYCNGGQSGGMVYYKPCSDFKSTVGIATHTSGLDTYGMRLNTTLLRFYFQNTNY